MKSFLNYKFLKKTSFKYGLLAGGIAIALIVIVRPSIVTAPISRQIKPPINQHKSESSPQKPGVSSSVVSPTSPVSMHIGVITTVFWVGEKANSDNGFIANKASAWDGQWLKHFGGVDDPSKRSGYQPAGFTPQENTFYVALPYDDLTDSGARKPSSTSCPLYLQMKNQPYSWCKNSWVMIRHGGKITYAQWEDVGPYEQDDINYVFGSSKPRNNIDVKSGLDVSPAVRDYLGLQDVDSTDWSFATVSQVPAGPWKLTITTNLGDSIN